VTGAFLVLFPKTRIRVLWFMILITMMMAPAWFFIGLQIAWNILARRHGQRGECRGRSRTSRGTRSGSRSRSGCSRPG
jgi:hypothetical protein